MSDYTASLGLEEITPGDQAGLWGNTTNNNLALIDQAVTGVTPISFTGLSGSVKTLESSNGALDEARAAVLNITGIATGANTVVVPNKQKTYLVRNNTGQNITFRTATPTATYAVETGNSILIFCDGDNNVFTGIQAPGSGTLGVAGGGTGATTFTAGFVKSPGGTGNLTSAAAVNAATEVTGILPVANGGTGVSATTPASGSLLIGTSSGGYARNTLTAGTGITITPSSGGITIAASVASGTVTSVSGTGTVNGLTLSGTVTTAGNLTLGGSLSGSAPSLSVGSATTATTASGLTGAPSITVTSLVSGSQNSTYAAIGGGAASVQLYNTNTGIYKDAGQFGFQANSVAVLFIANTTGSVTNISGSYTAVSDQRIKENIVPARSYLADLKKLNVVNYNLIGKQDKYLGLVAQEVQAVMPGLVDVNAGSDAFPDVPNLLSVKYSILIPMLLQAIQELSAKVTALEEQVLNLSVK